MRRFLPILITLLLCHSVSLQLIKASHICGNTCDEFNDQGICTHGCNIPGAAPNSDYHGDSSYHQEESVPAIAGTDGGNQAAAQKAVELYTSNQSYDIDPQAPSSNGASSIIELKSNLAAEVAAAQEQIATAASAVLPAGTGNCSICGTAGKGACDQKPIADQTFTCAFGCATGLSFCKSSGSCQNSCPNGETDAIGPESSNPTAYAAALQARNIANGGNVTAQTTSTSTEQATVPTGSSSDNSKDEITAIAQTARNNAKCDINFGLCQAIDPKTGAVTGWVPADKPVFCDSSCALAARMNVIIGSGYQTITIEGKQYQAYDWNGDIQELSLKSVDVTAIKKAADANKVKVDASNNAIIDLTKDQIADLQKRVDNFSKEQENVQKALATDINKKIPGLLAECNCSADKFTEFVKGKSEDLHLNLLTADNATQILTSVRSYAIDNELISSYSSLNSNSVIQACYNLLKNNADKTDCDNLDLARQTLRDAITSDNRTLADDQLRVNQKASDLAISYQNGGNVTTDQLKFAGLDAKQIAELTTVRQQNIEIARQNLINTAALNLYNSQSLYESQGALSGLDATSKLETQKRAQLLQEYLNCRSDKCSNLFSQLQSVFPKEVLTEVNKARTGQITFENAQFQIQTQAQAADQEKVRLLNTPKIEIVNGKSITSICVNLAQVKISTGEIKTCLWGCSAGACTPGSAKQIAAAVAAAKDAKVDLKEYLSQANSTDKQLFENSTVPEAIRQALIDQRLREILPSYVYNSPQRQKFEQVAATYIDSTLASGHLNPIGSNSPQAFNELLNKIAFLPIPDANKIVNSQQGIGKTIANSIFCNQNETYRNSHSKDCFTWSSLLIDTATSKALLPLTITGNPNPTFVQNIATSGMTFGDPNNPNFQAQYIPIVKTQCGIPAGTSDYSEEQKACLEARFTGLKFKFANIESQNKAIAAVNVIAVPLGFLSGGTSYALKQAGAHIALQFAPRLVQNVVVAAAFAANLTSSDRAGATAIQILANSGTGTPAQQQVWQEQATLAQQEVHAAYQQNFITGVALSVIMEGSGEAFGKFISPYNNNRFTEFFLGKNVLPDALDSFIEANKLSIIPDQIFSPEDVIKPQDQVRVGFITKNMERVSTAEPIQGSDFIKATRSIFGYSEGTIVETNGRMFKVTANGKLLEYLSPSGAVTTTIPLLQSGPAMAAHNATAAIITRDFDPVAKPSSPLPNDSIQILQPDGRILGTTIENVRNRPPQNAVALLTDTSSGSPLKRIIWFDESGLPIQFTSKTGAEPTIETLRQVADYIIPPEKLQTEIAQRLAQFSRSSNTPGLPDPKPGTGIMIAPQGDVALVNGQRFLKTPTTWLPDNIITKASMAIAAAIAPPTAATSVVPAPAPVPTAAAAKKVFATTKLVVTSLIENIFDNENLVTPPVTITTPSPNEIGRFVNLWANRIIFGSTGAVSEFVTNQIKNLQTKLTNPPAPAAQQLTQAKDFTKYLTGVDYTNPSLPQKLLDDHFVIKQKYGLPKRDVRFENSLDYIRELEKIAKENGIPIRDKSEFQQFFNENPIAGALYDDKGGQIFINLSKDPVQLAGDLEHELIHALQHQKYPGMPIENREYEAYVGANMRTGDNFLQDPENIANLSGQIGSSAKNWYKEEKLPIPWEQLPPAAPSAPAPASAIFQISSQVLGPLGSQVVSIGRTLWAQLTQSTSQPTSIYSVTKDPFVRDIVKNPYYENDIKLALKEFGKQTPQTTQELALLIYEHFYNTPKTQNERGVNNFDISNRVSNSAKKLLNGLAGVDSPTGIDWVYASGLKGVNLRKIEAESDGIKIGRIYINSKYEFTPKVFAKVVSLLKEKGLTADAKARGRILGPKRLDNKDKFNQRASFTDQIVIYFDASNQRQILEVVDEVWHEFEASNFNPSLPSFTAQLWKDSKPMIGFAFAQAPYSVGSSYGESISYALASLYKEKGIDITNKEVVTGELKTYFKDSQKRNPENPAFKLAYSNRKGLLPGETEVGLPRGEELFSSIYQRTILTENPPPPPAAPAPTAIQSKSTLPTTITAIWNHLNKPLFNVRGVPVSTLDILNPWGKFGEIGQLGLNPYSEYTQVEKTLDGVFGSMPSQMFVNTVLDMQKKYGADKTHSYLGRIKLTEIYSEMPLSNRELLNQRSSPPSLDAELIIFLDTLDFGIPNNDPDYSRIQALKIFELADNPEIMAARTGLDVQVINQIATDSRQIAIDAFRKDFKLAYDAEVLPEFDLSASVSHIIFLTSGEMKKIKMVNGSHGSANSTARLILIDAEFIKDLEDKIITAGKYIAVHEFGHLLANNKWLIKQQMTDLRLFKNLEEARTIVFEMEAMGARGYYWSNYHSPEYEAVRIIFVNKIIAKLHEVSPDRVTQLLNQIKLGDFSGVIEAFGGVEQFEDFLASPDIFGSQILITPETTVAHSNGKVDTLGVDGAMYISRGDTITTFDGKSFTLDQSVKVELSFGYSHTAADPNYYWTWNDDDGPIGIGTGMSMRINYLAVSPDSLPALPTLIVASQPQSPSLPVLLVPIVQNTFFPLFPPLAHLLATNPQFISQVNWYWNNRGLVASSLFARKQLANQFPPTLPENDIALSLEVEQPSLERGISFERTLIIQLIFNRIKIRIDEKLSLSPSNRQNGLNPYSFVDTESESLSTEEKYALDEAVNHYLQNIETTILKADPTIPVNVLSGENPNNLLNDIRYQKDLVITGNFIPESKKLVISSDQSLLSSNPQQQGVKFKLSHSEGPLPGSNTLILHVTYPEITSNTNIDRVLANSTLSNLVRSINQTGYGNNLDGVLIQIDGIPNYIMASEFLVKPENVFRGNRKSLEDYPNRVKGYWLQDGTLALYDEDHIGGANKYGIANGWDFVSEPIFGFNGLDAGEAWSESSPLEIWGPALATRLLRIGMDENVKIGLRGRITGYGLVTYADTVGSLSQGINLNLVSKDNIGYLSNVTISGENQSLKIIRGSKYSTQKYGKFIVNYIVEKEEIFDIRFESGGQAQWGKNEFVELIDNNDIDEIGVVSQLFEYELFPLNQLNSHRLNTALSAKQPLTGILKSNGEFVWTTEKTDHNQLKLITATLDREVTAQVSYQPQTDTWSISGSPLGINQLSTRILNNSASPKSFVKASFFGSYTTTFTGFLNDLPELSQELVDHNKFPPSPTLPILLANFAGAINPAIIPFVQSLSENWPAITTQFDILRGFTPRNFLNLVTQPLQNWQWPGQKTPLQDTNDVTKVNQELYSPSQNIQTDEQQRISDLADFIYFLNSRGVISLTGNANQRQEVISSVLAKRQRDVQKISPLLAQSLAAHDLLSEKYGGLIISDPTQIDAGSLLVTVVDKDTMQKINSDNPLAFVNPKYGALVISQEAISSPEKIQRVLDHETSHIIYDPVYRSTLKTQAQKYFGADRYKGYVRLINEGLTELRTYYSRPSAYTNKGQFYNQLSSEFASGMEVFDIEIRNNLSRQGLNPNEIDQLLLSVSANGLNPLVEKVGGWNNFFKFFEPLNQEARSLDPSIKETTPPPPLSPTTFLQSLQIGDTVRIEGIDYTATAQNPIPLNIVENLPNGVIIKVTKANGDVSYYKSDDGSIVPSAPIPNETGGGFTDLAVPLPNAKTDKIKLETLERFFPGDEVNYREVPWQGWEKELDMFTQTLEPNELLSAKRHLGNILRFIKPQNLAQTGLDFTPSFVAAHLSVTDIWGIVRGSGTAARGGRPVEAYLKLLFALMPFTPTTTTHQFTDKWMAFRMAIMAKESISTAFPENNWQTVNIQAKGKPEMSFTYSASGLNARMGEIIDLLLQEGTFITVTLKDGNISNYIIQNGKLVITNEGIGGGGATSNEKIRKVNRANILTGLLLLLKGDRPLPVPPLCQFTGQMGIDTKKMKSEIEKAFGITIKESNLCTSDHTKSPPMWSTKPWSPTELTTIQNTLDRLGKSCFLDKINVPAISKAGSDQKAKCEKDAAFNNNGVFFCYDRYSIPTSRKIQNKFLGNTSLEYLEQTLIHEMAHSYFWNNNPFVNLQHITDWTKNTGYSLQISNPQAPTIYGQSNFSEDFAESVRLYTTQPSTLKTASPVRYSYLKDNLFCGYEY